MKKIKKIMAIVADKMYFPLFLSAAKKKFKTLKEKSNNFDSDWNLSNDFYFGLKRKSLNFNISSLQKKTEISRLVKNVENIKPKIILEIGTAGGGTLFYWTRVSQPDAIIISIDLPFGRFGSGYLPTKAKFLKCLARQNQKIFLIPGDSHKNETLDKLNKILCGRKIDFLFIDGDHTYPGIKSDFYIYSKLVRSGGIIALHDIMYHKFDTDAKVYKFWNEIKKLYSYEEYIESPDQDGYGLGVIYIK